MEVMIFFIPIFCLNLSAYIIQIILKVLVWKLLSCIQTCNQQPPKRNDKTGCLRQVAADHKIHHLVGFVQVFVSSHIIYIYTTAIKVIIYIVNSKLILDKTFMRGKKVIECLNYDYQSSQKYEQFPHFQQCF